MITSEVKCIFGGDIINVEIKTPKYERKIKILTNEKEIIELMDKYRFDRTAKFLIDGKEVFICSINVNRLERNCKVEYIETINI